MPREPVQDDLPAGALLLGGVRFFRVEGLPDGDAVARLDELHAQRAVAEGVFDLDDLKYRTDELADFVAAAAEHYGFDANQLLAVGYSNGANIAASMLLLRPEVLPNAILFRPMVPLHPAKEPNLSSVRVWIGAGTNDPIIPMSETNALAELLRNAGAEVTIRYFQAGHDLTSQDLEAARDWLALLC